MPVDREKLQAINVTGLELVLFAVNLTIDIVSVLHPPKEKSEKILEDIATAADGFVREAAAKGFDNTHLVALFKEFRDGLFSTESTR